MLLDRIGKGGYSSDRDWGYNTESNLQPCYNFWHIAMLFNKKKKRFSHRQEEKKDENRDRSREMWPLSCQRQFIREHLSIG